MPPRAMRSYNSPAPIAGLFNIRPSFLRSVNVALDYSDSASSRSYVVTDFVWEAFSRMAVGLQAGSTERAWRVAGDYGSGKSAFALCLARIGAQSRAELPPDLHGFIRKDMRLEPVLVSGSPEPLEKSIRKALADLRSRVFRAPAKSLEAAAAGDGSLSELLDQHIAALQEQKIANGLMLILDELGQNLQHAVLHPSAGDISLLQSLGEKADRSRNRPLMVVALLHQGLSAYSANAGLDVTARREWDKVAGRFKEIVFAQPMEQVAVLVAEMLGVTANRLPAEARAEAQRGMRRAAATGLYGAAPAEESLAALAPRLFPLHPTVFPVLLKLLRRFGQNERSLVGFLSSHEPFGFRDFASANSLGDKFFRIADLYDYFRANLASGLTGGHAAHWEVIQATVNHATEMAEPALAILKTVGLVNLLNDPGLVASEALVDASVGHREVPASIKCLRTGLGLLHERGNIKGLSLWPHTSVNLDNATDEADRALASEPVTARAIAAGLTPRAVVARRHYILTGNLRHFGVTYLDLPALRELLAAPVPEKPGSDGQVFMVLPSGEAEFGAATSLINERKAHLGPLVFVGVSMPVSQAVSITRELRRWQWIHENLRSLAGDAFARAHVVRETRREKLRLERALQHVIQLRDGHEAHEKITWFGVHGIIKASSTKGILPQLSESCRQVFSLCPNVPNELINRRITSSAASKARSILIEAIATTADQEKLGFDPAKTPPEYSIYLSVLLAGRIHVKSGDTWRIRDCAEIANDDPLQLGPSLNRIHQMLMEADTKRCSVPAIFAVLRAAPFGVRDGFIPLLLAIYLAGQWDQTAIYEDGTFIEKPGAELFQRLAKEPEAFDLQHCSVLGVRRELFNRVASILGLPQTRQPDVLQVIRPLIVFAARLPEYSKHSERHLDPRTRRMRESLLGAREPATLLFSELPRAYDFAPFSVQAVKGNEKEAMAFAEALNHGVLELRESYPRLLTRLGESVRAAFHFTGTLAEFRAQFVIRRRAVEHAVTEKEMEVFARRLAEEGYGEREWLESIGTYLGQKAPERWRDTDEDEFHQRVASLAARFARIEALGFNGKVIDPEKLGRAIRFTLTRPDGSERDRVVHWSSKDQAEVTDAIGEMEKLMKRLGPSGLPAAAHFVWEHLEKNKLHP